MSKVYLSVIVPFYNEELNLPQFHQELVEVLKSLKKNCQIVYVNDASTDNSVKNLTDAFNRTNLEKNITVKLISLKRNFGQTAAISAGIDSTDAEFVAFMDSDLQMDPKDLPKMMTKIEDGFDVVAGWRKNRKDDFLRVLLSKVANSIIRLIFQTPFHDIGCSLKVIRGENLKDIRIYGESHRLISVLLYWRGAQVTEQIISHRRRISGKSKYGYSRIIKIVLDLITAKFLNSYGTKPSYVFGTFGIVSILISILMMLYVLYHKFYFGVFVHRNPVFLIGSFLMLLGILFILMGLLAELIVRTYFETQKKSTYEVRYIKNF